MTMMIDRWYREHKGECPNCKMDLKKQGDELNLWPHYIGYCEKPAIDKVIQRYSYTPMGMSEDERGVWVKLEDVESVLETRKA